MSLEEIDEALSSEPQSAIDEVDTDLDYETNHRIGEMSADYATDPDEGY